MKSQFYYFYSEFFAEAFLQKGRRTPRKNHSSIFSSSAKSRLAVWPRTVYHSMGEIPSPGRLVSKFSAVNTSPALMAARHNALAGNGLVGGFAGGQVLVAVAKGGFHMAHGLYHGLELGRVQAGFLVRSGPGFIQRKVLFNHLRTKYRGSNIAFPAGVWSESPTGRPNWSKSSSMAVRLASS